MADTEDKILRDIATTTQDDQLLAETPQEEGEYVPTYKVIGETKLPVSKSAGKLWKSRKESAVTKLKRTGKIEAWDEVIRYYKNDQRVGRSEIGDDEVGARSSGGRIGRNNGMETENIVFANTQAMVPAIYAKNPRAEVTPNVRDDNEPDGADDDMALLAKVCERLINALAAKKESPGFNLKPKAKQAVVMTCLTNLSFLEVGYTRREEAQETSLTDLQTLSERLAKAKNIKEIEEIEGELEALENKTSFLRPSGPWVKYRRGKDVLFDPDAEDPEFSDAKWAMTWDFVSTAFINAVYRTKNENNEWESIYKPTHIIGLGDEVSEIQDQINSFSLIGDDTSHDSHGYKDSDSFRAAARTKVWYVWDKITRRVYMYNDEDWSWPIWVWNDPYNLDRFFPFYPLQFNTDPEEAIGLSEVMMYLDQQDAINEINSELSRLRKRAIGSIAYNMNVVNDPAIIDAMLQGGEELKAVGLDLPPDTDLGKAFFALMPPSAQYAELFDVKPKIEAAQRLSSVPAIMRNEQLKTNTTEDAVAAYNSQAQTRLDEKIDAVEDLIGEVMWGIAQMCMQFMGPEEVSMILGPKDAEAWTVLTPEEIRQKFSAQIVGGSSQKPTSNAKKEEALKLGQVVGQFASNGGASAMLVILKMMERAFDEFVLTQDDWAFIRATLETQLQGGGGQAAPQGTGAPPQAGPSSPQPAAPPNEALAQIAQVIDNLPPEVKEAIGTAMARGVPIEEVIPRVIEMMETQASVQ